MALCMVGEALISACVEILIKRIASREFRDFFSSRKLNISLLDELKTKLLVLNAVLNDAEEKQITDSAVKQWLDELRDVVLDAEDLLDEINTHALRCKGEGKSRKFATKLVAETRTWRPISSYLLAVNSLLHYLLLKCLFQSSYHI
ncbi:putative disease resistance protein [Vigna angularis]|uniref:Putative disease resistance protein n=1 Tax=Phaseolus angularis TaxID=3914 RepID=A0A8T0K574_PHAAN|nr:putative disease resistance protein [Vigna angularis]